MGKLDDSEVRWLLSAATRDLVTRAGRLERAAVTCGLSTSHLQRCCDPDSDSILPVVAAILLEQDTGKPIVTELLASLAGYRLVPIDGAPVAAAPVADAFAGTVREVGDVLTTTSSAIADGVVTETEARHIANAIGGAKVQLDGLSRALASHGSRVTRLQKP
jgi:hypothetical protein